MLALLVSLAFLEDPVPAPAPPAPPAPVLPAPRAGPAPPALPVPPVRREVRAVVVGGDDDVLVGDWPATPSGKRITIEDRITIDDAVGQIGDAAGWSISLNTGRVGERLLVAKLRDVPVEDALRAALEGTGLVATRRGGIVVVAPSLAPVREVPVLSGFETPSGKRFSGDFQDTDGRDALLEIGKAAGLSIVLPPGTLGKVTAHFKDTPVEEALKAVLAQADLQAERDGSIVNVTPRREGLAGRFVFQGDFGPELGRTVQREMDRARREMERAQRELGRHGSSGDRHAVGNDVTVEAGQTAQDVVAVMGSATLRSGAEGRDVVAVMGDVTLDAGAQADQVVAVFGDVRVGPGALVAGDAVSVGGRVQIDPTGEVGGQTQQIPLPRIGKVVVGDWLPHHDTNPLWTIAAVVAKFAVYFAMGLLLVALFPQRLEVIAASMVANPGKTLLAGFLGLVAQPFLLVLLVVTLIGIPLVAVQVLALLAAAVMGFTALAWFIGRRMPEQVSRGALALQLAIGTGIVVVLTQVPVLGWLIWVVLVMFTLGAVIRTRFGQPPAVMPTVMAPPPMPPPAPPPAPAT
jgi:hypothetical protein